MRFLLKGNKKEGTLVKECLLFVYLSLEFKVIHTAFKNRLIFVARHIPENVGTSALRMAHLSKDASIWAGEPFNGIQDRKSVV